MQQGGPSRNIEDSAGTSPEQHKHIVGRRVTFRSKARQTLIAKEYRIHG